MQDYRDEVKDFFAIDKQLAAEIEYDMKRYEKQLDWETQNELVNSVATSMIIGSPRVRTQTAFLKK